MAFCKSCGKELPSNARFCPACGAPVTEPFSAPTEIHRSFDVKGKPRVVLASFVPGKIEVKGGLAGKVEVDLNLRRAEDMDWNVYQEGDLVMISFRNTSRTYWSWASHPDSGPSADVSLAVPSECDIDIENKIDRVSIKDVKGVIVVNSAIASVYASGCGGNLKLRTKTGSVEMDGIDGTVFAETATGMIRFSGALSSADNFFRTSIGMIEISLKGVPDLMVEARSGIGSVVSALPLSDVRSENNRVFGRLGAGTGHLRAETSTGNIRMGP